MRLVTEREFLKWAAQRDVVLDPRWSESGGTRWLKLGSNEDAHRFWITPTEASGRLTFIAHLLRSMGEVGTWGVFKREGGWTYAHEEDGRRPILDAIGLKESRCPAVMLDAADQSALILVILVQLAFGWCTRDDIWVVPDDGRHALYTDHHGVIQVSFADKECVDEFVKRMSAAGFELPTVPPDATFRWPDWMGPEPAGWDEE